MQTVSYVDRKLGRQVYVQTGRHVKGRHVDMQTGRQVDIVYWQTGRFGRQVYMYTGRQVDMYTGIYVDRQIFRNVDRQTGRYVDRQSGRQVVQVDKQIGRPLRFNGLTLSSKNR